MDISGPDADYRAHLGAPNHAQQPTTTGACRHADTGNVKHSTRGFVYSLVNPEYCSQRGPLRYGSTIGDA